MPKKVPDISQEEALKIVRGAVSSFIGYLSFQEDMMIGRNSDIGELIRKADEWAAVRGVPADAEFGWAERIGLERPSMDEGFTP